MTLFLQLDAVLGPAKATLGETIETSFGSGVVRAYAIRLDTYTIDLGKRLSCRASYLSAPTPPPPPRFGVLDKHC